MVVLCDTMELADLTSLLSNFNGNDKSCNNGSRTNETMMSALEKASEDTNWRVRTQTTELIGDFFKKLIQEEHNRRNSLTNGCQRATPPHSRPLTPADGICDTMTPENLANRESNKSTTINDKQLSLTDANVPTSDLMSDIANHPSNTATTATEINDNTPQVNRIVNKCVSLIARLAWMDWSPHVRKVALRILETCPDQLLIDTILNEAQNRRDEVRVQIFHLVASRPNKQCDSRLFTCVLAALKDVNTPVRYAACQVSEGFVGV